MSIKLIGSLKPQGTCRVQMPATFRYHSWGGTGTRYNDNTNGTESNAVDRNQNTLTNTWRAIYTESRVWTRYVSTVKYTGYVRIDYRDFITNGYGNTSHHVVFYDTQAQYDAGFTSNITLYNNTNYYSNLSWTNRSRIFYVTDLRSIGLWYRDTGKGAPHFIIREIYYVNKDGSRRDIFGSARNTLINS